MPNDCLAKISPKATISHTRVVDAGRIITAGGIANGMEMELNLLEKAGYDAQFMRNVAGVVEYE